jgi:ABC-type transport system substrate-binding protein
VFRNSAGQPISIDVTASNQAGNVEEAEAVASQWSAAGFVSSPTPYPSSAANAAEIRAKNPGALIFPLTFTLQTALGALTSSEVGTEQNKWAGGNYGGYVNPAYDALYSGFLNTLDPAQRTDTIFQMLKVVDEELPILPLNFAPLAVIARHGVEGPGMMSVIQGGSAWNIHTWDITSS